MSHTKTICVIPARGGSKRIPGKNIRDFHGRPMLHHAIDIAARAGCFDLVLVSTDSPEVGACAMAYPDRSIQIGVYDRRPELATDFATTGAVIADIADAWPASTLICCLYPCTPLTDHEHLASAVELFDSYCEDGAEFVMPVAVQRPAMQRALRMEGGIIKPVWPQFENVRSQDLEPRYRDAGQWYLAEARSWQTHRDQSIYTGAVGLQIPAWRAIDIDDEDDWMMAHAVYAAHTGHLEDAARYRWLKANHLQIGPDAWIRTGDDLDDAIDAGRSKVL